ncbi:MAG: hypothetical protein LUE64_03255 [Candidatus Gastranaerophilales bacterium]|nr:hypothetical protein [Candidatus Gastranaerophilales bacterium]
MDTENENLYTIEQKQVQIKETIEHDENPEPKAEQNKELELALAKKEISELKEKYLQKEKECMIAKQKENTLELLSQSGLDSSALELVLVPSNEEMTKERIAVLKDYIEDVKKEILKNYIDAPLPLSSGKAADYDAFIDGFDSNKL